jgi:hypothetical protein
VINSAKCFIVEDFNSKVLPKLTKYEDGLAVFIERIEIDE